MFFKTKVCIASAGLMVLAASAQAQSLCGGIGDNGQWIGGSETASDVTTFPDFQEQMALVLGGNEYVSLFRTTALTDIRVEAAGRGAGDPVIDLYDSNGNLVVSDDDSGGNSAARAETTVDAGTYCLAMRSFDNAPMTAFVRIGRTEHEALTQGVSDSVDAQPDTGAVPGDCSSPATRDLVLGQAQTASVADVASWRVTLDRAMALTITATNPTADPYVTLLDPSGQTIGENDDFDGLNSRLDMSSALDAGTYCITMQALSDSTAPVTVLAAEYDPTAAIAALYDRGEAAPPLDGSHMITGLGTLSGRLRIDAQNSAVATWFSVDVPEAGLILIEAIAAGGNGDPILYLYDDLGRLVEMNDDFGGGYDSQITAKVNAGTYLVALRDVNDGGQGFVRVVMERYVPAK